MPHASEDMSGFGAHLPACPQPRRHFLDEMCRSGDLGLFALRDIEPSAKERRLDLLAGYALRFHDAVSPMLRSSGLT